MAFWESVKGSQRSSELQAYLSKFPDGVFAMLAKARIEEIKTTVSSNRPTDASNISTQSSELPLKSALASFASSVAANNFALDNGVIGTLIITDSITGIKRSLEVKIDSVDAEKTTYSSGDIISNTGQVLQARIGDAILKVVSGELWTFPLKAGTSGGAKIIRPDMTYESPGTVDWKAVALGDNRIQIEATVSFRAVNSVGSGSAIAFGKWIGAYRGDQVLPESFSSAIRASYVTYTNLFTAVFKHK